jgi:putative PIN family toxin of toxin-antitoxin system
VLGVTADTNVYVSALAFGGKPLQILEMAAQGLIRLSISDAIVEETIRVLSDKFQWEKAALREADATIRSIAEIVTPTQVVDVVKTDPPDNRVLECAAEAKSDYIVSGDRDLLKLGRFGDIPIVRVVEFLKATLEEGRSAR